MTDAVNHGGGRRPAAGKFVAPELDRPAFNCPHCGAYTQHRWIRCVAAQDARPEFKAAICILCEDCSVWKGTTWVYPTTGGAPAPNPDLPDEIRDDYEEARVIASLSPRGAAALLRLGIQKLCVSLGESGKNLSGDIGRLVDKGLRPDVQQALDAVRVIGNNAVHPGQMDIKDDKATAERLFVLINVIAEAMITHPKQIADVYDSLPDDTKQQIEKSDA